VADLIAIGRFARLTGLSIGALRHYAELGLLEPARVDPATGYRSYRAAQLDRGRTIARLRSIDLSLDEIRAVLAIDDETLRAAELRAVRDRLEARTWRLQRAIHILNQLVEGKEPLVPVDAPDRSLTAEQHRRLGIDLFNFTWTLLERPVRTPAEMDTMIHAAHASRYHWGEAVTRGAEKSIPANLARGEWQCSRVYAALGRPEAALWHARRVLEICESNGIGDWDLAFAYEALARASRVAGDTAAVEQWLEKARAAGDDIAEQEDRDLLLSDLATV
jgi:DNA-binding transcriptional MerR regulator